MGDKIFLDTNILVYLANEDSSFHHGVLTRFRELSKQYELWISRQVLREYAVVMTGSAALEKPLSPKKVIADMERWEDLLQVADETDEVTEVLKELIETYSIKGKRIHDANIIATMRANLIDTLFTLNRGDFKIFEKIKVISI
jgi:predicted nucleic acid-binding protein